MRERRQGPRFASLFPSRNILCRLDAPDRDTAVRALLRHLALEEGIGNVENAFQAVLDRENQGATLLGDAIAVPHARLDAVNDLVIGLATSPAGFLFPGGARPRVLFLFLVPQARPGLYLSALSALAASCRAPDAANILSDYADPAEVWGFFERGGESLPAHLLVRHIMELPATTLGENDSLGRAIDLFVERGVTELPVVDAAGALVGVVTTRQLFRVCLPDYILWVEDLSPFLNFEPFAEVLRKESRTWLAEIMTADYAIVSEDDPAVYAAKEITRRGNEYAYVVQGDKLIGVVSLHGMLRRIMRD